MSASRLQSLLQPLFKHRYVFTKTYCRFTKNKSFTDSYHTCPGLRWEKNHRVLVHSTRSLQTGDSPTEDTFLKSPYPDVTIPKTSFTEYMFSSFKNYGDVTALIDQPTGRSYTYRQLQETVIKLGSALHKLGYRRGDRILMYSTNCPEYAILFLACGALGVVLSTANPSYTAGELARQLEHSGSVAVVTLPELLGTVREALGSKKNITEQVKNIFILGEADGCRPFFSLLEDDGKAFPENVDIDPVKDMLMLPYSSGTTGLPKGVMLTHYNITANIQQISDGLQLVPGADSILGVLPLYHLYGIVVSQFLCLQQGAAFITMPRFYPEEFLKAIQTHKITDLHIVPPLVLFLAKDPMVLKYDISSVKTVVSAAAPLGVALSEELQTRVNAVILQAYGMTETGPVVLFNRPPERHGTVGQLVANTDGKVVNSATGKSLGVGEEGEIYVRGPQIMKGYLNNSKATTEMVKDGWLSTGDIGHYDKDGYFTVTDRLKELIKYKGHQVAPAELEALILTHPDIKDVAVVGIPEEGTGELPKAYIVPKPGRNIKAEDISEFVSKNVAPYKRLRGGVEIIDEIPKSASGKILRRLLRDSYK